MATRLATASYAVPLRRPYCTDNGIAITIRRVNPSNPLRNVRIIMPGLGGRETIS